MHDFQPNFASQQIIIVISVSINFCLLYYFASSGSFVDDIFSPALSLSSSSFLPVSEQENATVNTAETPENRVHCSDVQYARQVEYVKKKLAENSPYQFGCVEPINILPYLKAIWGRNRETIVFVNVGANKGYDIAEWLNTWEPQLNISPKKWGVKFLNATRRKTSDKPPFMCGVCNLCDLTISPENSLLSPSWPLNGHTVVGIEPMPSNFKLLESFKTFFGYDKLVLINSAVGDKPGVAFIKNESPGTEDVGIQKGQERNSSLVSVNVTTVDEIMASLNLKLIHFLKIDTEGFDAKVLQGSRNALLGHRILFIEFEYHYFWPKEEKIQKVVEELDGFGYDCYLKTDNSLVRLTGCFDKAFEFRLWSNVYCSLRKEIALSAFLLSHSLVSWDG